MSEGNKEYINKVLNEERTSLIKKLSECASIQVETLEITAENEASISKVLNQKKQGSISKSKGLKLLQKELINEAVDALDSKNNTTAEQFAEIFRQLEVAKKDKLAYNEEVRACPQTNYVAHVILFSKSLLIAKYIIFSVEEENKSYSLDSLLFLPSQANVHSTTHLRGCILKPGSIFGN